MKLFKNLTVLVMKGVISLESLIVKVISGDRNSANQLIRMYYDEIYIYVYNYTLNKEIALDLTQEIFMRVLKKLKTYQSSKGSFKNWLYQVAHNYVMNYFKTKGYKDKLVQLEMEQFAEDFNILDNFINKENELLLSSAILRLNHKYREIIIMRYYEDYSIKEIANTLNINENTVKTRLRRGLSELKVNLKWGEVYENR